MLDSIINFMAYGSLLFAAAAAYLQLNKLWQRKHLPEVAASISISGIVVESIPLFFFGIYFLNKGEWIGIIDSGIWLVSASLVTLIGAGFWVPGRGSKSIFQLALNSLSRERTEVSYLARQILQPTSSRELLNVLTSMAIVDGEIHQREIELVQSFVDDWGLEMDWSAVASAPPASRSHRLLQARETVGAYLATRPPKSQATHLKDLLQLLVDVDENCAAEERMALDEVGGMLAEYASELHGDLARHSVIIAPQSDAQDEAISMLLKDVPIVEHGGGRCYHVGRYYSTRFAEMICAKYRAAGFFTVVIQESVP